MQEADVATGNGRPGALVAPQVPASYPLPAPVPVGAGGYMWSFSGDIAGMNQAHHFAGALQALNPGLRCRIYRTTSSFPLAL